MRKLKFSIPSIPNESKKCIFICLLILLNLNIGYGQPANSPWPMFHHDPQHTGRSAYVGPEVPNLLWTFSARNWIQSSVAIGEDGTIYVGSSDYCLYAINPDGTLKWYFVTGSFIDASPAIDLHGNIYVGSCDGKLYAIKPDGKLKWSFSQGNTPTTPTIGPDGTIYIGSEDNKLFALDTSGAIKWEFVANSKVGCPAIGTDGIIYVGSDDGNFYALFPDKKLKWMTNLGTKSIRSTPVISPDGIIYVGSYDYRLYSINSADGKIEWSYPTGGIVLSSPGIGVDGTIYVGSFDSKLYAINPNGTLKWKFDTGEAIWGSSPGIGADGTLYIGSFDNKFYAINPDGSLKWEFSTDDDIFASPAIGKDGTIYIGSKDGKLYAIGNVSGSLLTGSFVWTKNHENDQPAYEALLDEMKALNLFTIILFNTGHIKIEGDPYGEHQLIKEYEVDNTAIGWMLDEAFIRGMNVYIGLFSEQMHVPVIEFWRDELMTKIIENSVRKVAEIEKDYGSHPSLKGYYVPQEANVGIHLVDVINQFYSTLVSQVHAAAPNKKVIAGGYMLQKQITLNQIKDWVFKFKSNGLDIFLLQDGVGSFDNSLTTYPTIYNHFVAAREGASPIPLWADIELFQWSSKGETTKTVTPNDNWYHPANIKRINQQIYYANVAGAAEKISWMNEHHMTLLTKDAMGPEEAAHLYRGYKALYYSGTYYENPAYSYSPQPATQYPDKGGMLFDKTEGQSPWSDWVGFGQPQNSKVTITIDLGVVKPVSDITAVVRTETKSDIYYPTTMTVQVSRDGINYSSLGFMNNPYQNRVEYSKAYLWVSAVTSQQARYVKIEFIHGGYWLFLSELEVYHETGTPVSVKEEKFCKPKAYDLMQNYPNPFNATTNIRFGLPTGSKVKIDIYNTIGQYMKTLLDSWEPAGFHSIELHAQNLTSGIYIYRIQAGDFVQAKKMILLK